MDWVSPRFELHLRTPAGKLSFMTKRTMSEDHKAAIAATKRETAIIDRYLVALGKHARKRRLTPETIQRRIDALDRQMSGVKPSRRLEFVQQRINLVDQLALENNDREAMEAEFIEIAKGYSERKGITREAWRAMGVPLSVLRRAGL